MAMLVSGLKAARMCGGWVKLAGASEQVANIFRITLRDRVFELYPKAAASPAS